jgi:hypothetical protein
MSLGLTRMFGNPTIIKPSTSITTAPKERGSTVVDGAIFVVLGDPTRLPAELIAGADFRIRVRPTRRALRRALWRLYGKWTVVRHADFAGLDWPELLVALRPNDSERLRGAMAQDLSWPERADRR